MINKIPPEKMVKLKRMLLGLPNTQLQEVKSYLNGLCTVAGRNQAVRTANSERRKE